MQKQKPLNKDTVPNGLWQRLQDSFAVGRSQSKTPKRDRRVLSGVRQPGWFRA